MVHVHTSYECAICRQRFPFFDEARSCEGMHAIDAAVERTREKIAEAFAKAIQDHAPKPYSETD